MTEIYGTDTLGFGLHGIPGGAVFSLALILVDGAGLVGMAYWRRSKRKCS